MTTEQNRPCSRCGTPTPIRYRADGYAKSYCPTCHAETQRPQTRRRQATLRQQRAHLTDAQVWLLAQTRTGGTKYCPSCEQDVIVTPRNWYLRRDTPTAVHGWCRVCCLAYDAMKREQRAHRA